MPTAQRVHVDAERCGVSATTVHPGGIRTNIVRNARLDPDSPVGRNENPMGDRTNTPRYENQEKNGPDVATVAPFGTSEMRFPF